MRILILIVLVVGLTPILLQASDDVKCNPAGSQIELNACAKDEFDKSDKELNRVYQALIKKESSDTLFIKKLKQAQKAWLSFRDADLDAYFACSDPDVRVCFGSMYPLSYLSRKAELTRERTKQLQHILQSGRGD